MPQTNATNGNVVKQILCCLADAAPKYLTSSAIKTKTDALTIFSLRAYLTDLVEQGWIERLNLRALRYGVTTDVPNQSTGADELAPSLIGRKRLLPSEFLGLLREKGVLFKEAREIGRAFAAYRLSEKGRQRWLTCVESEISDLLIER